VIVRGGIDLNKPRMRVALSAASDGFTAEVSEAK
jgi:hypothetical protein